MKQRTVIEALASAINARNNCIDLCNFTWAGRHEDTIEEICDNHLPSGSGVDNGTTIDLGASLDDKVVLLSSYHAMNDGGMYVEWYDFLVTVTPSLVNVFNIDIDIPAKIEKVAPGVTEYLYDLFDNALAAPVTGL